MMAGKEISGLALQYGRDSRPPPKKHRDGAERALTPAQREISPVAMEKGGAETSHPSTPSPSRNPSLDSVRKNKPMANMVHMRRTPEERASANMPILSDETNHGMCFELCGPELDKLDMDGMPDPDDLLHFTCMARVVGVHHDAGGPRVRLEVIGMKIENESDEDMGLDDGERMKNRYGDEEDHY